MNDVVIVGAVRTPIGAFLGGLSSLKASKLGEIAISEAIRRAGVDAGEVSDVIMGQVLTAGVGQNAARQAAIGAGTISVAVEIAADLCDRIISRWRITGDTPV